MKFILVCYMSFFAFISCNTDDHNAKEVKMLESTVLERTEGLIILEKMMGHSNYYQHEMICNKIINFYTNSQPNLVGLCSSKELNLSIGKYEHIVKEIENSFEDTSAYYDILVSKLIDNLKQQKATYLQILEDPELDNLHYYILDSYLQVCCFIDDFHYSTPQRFASK